MDPRSSSTPLPVVLSIAGFDPTGGAGITADLKTFSAHNCYGTAAATAITIQTTQGVRGVQIVGGSVLRDQLAALIEDIPIAAVKVGMLGSAENVEVVVETIQKYALPRVVLDPVFVSTSGAQLLDPAGVELVRDQLMRQVNVVTPNLDEAKALTGREVRNVEEMKQAAAQIYNDCGTLAVITGGHLEKPQDVFFDGKDHHVFAGDRVRSENTHGTGCAFSSAIAANLALGKPVGDSIVLAKAYVTQAMEKGFRLGAGHGLLNHLYRLYASPPARAVVPEAPEPHGAGHR